MNEQMLVGSVDGIHWLFLLVIGIFLYVKLVFYVAKGKK